MTMTSPILPIGLGLVGAAALAWWWFGGFPAAPGGFVAAPPGAPPGGGTSGGGVGKGAGGVTTDAVPAGKGTGSVAPARADAFAAYEEGAGRGAEKGYVEGSTGAVQTHNAGASTKVPAAYRAGFECGFAKGRALGVDIATKFGGVFVPADIAGGAEDAIVTDCGSSHFPAWWASFRTGDVTVAGVVAGMGDAGDAGDAGPCPCAGRLLAGRLVIGPRRRLPGRVSS